MKKQIITLMLLTSTFQTHAIPKYLDEQLPDQSLIKQLYQQQKAQTTNNHLLKKIETLDKNIEDFVEVLFPIMLRSSQKNKDVVAEGIALGVVLEAQKDLTEIFKFTGEKLVISGTPIHLTKELQQQERLFLANLMKKLLCNSIDNVSCS